MYEKLRGFSNAIGLLSTGGFFFYFTISQTIVWRIEMIGNSGMYNRFVFLCPFCVCRFAGVIDIGRIDIEVEETREIQRLDSTINNVWIQDGQT